MALIVNQQPTDLTQLFTSLIAFAFSFYILVSVWWRYTSLMSYLPVETPGLIILNILLLFLVSIEPYLLNLLAFHTPSFQAIGWAASSLYGLDFAGMNIILAVFMQVLVDEDRRLVPPAMLERFRRIRNILFANGAIFLFSLLPIFWDTQEAATPLRFIIWFAVAPGIMVSRLLARTPKQQNKPGLQEHDSGSTQN